MSDTIFANWWTGLLVMIVIALLTVSFIMQLHEWGMRPLKDVSKILNRPWFERLLLLFFVCGMVQYAATKGTGNGSRSSGTETRNDTVDEIEMTALRSGNSQESGEITNLCFTGIAVLTNGVELNIAWPTNFFVHGTTLDFFAKYHSITNAWQWFAYSSTYSGMTNLTVVADWHDDLGCVTNPSAMFFKVQDRATCAATMADADGDGLPDVYELNNGTNPYVSDYALAPRLTVGTDCDYGTLNAALAASTDYSIVEMSTEEASFSQTITLPSHPVLITGPQDGYARLYSSADIAMFLLDEGQGNETLFRNLYVILTARSSFQAAFWIGENLPWSGIGASPAFENVRVRALYPNVLHYGWHYYVDDGGDSWISNCVMNAAGSTSAVGVYAYNGPDVVVSDCAFVNFPTNPGNYASWIRTGTNIVAVLSQTDTNLSWAGYALNGSYGSSVDSDGDGLSDHDEIRIHDTDPWLADSDGDGMTDAEEIESGTDPRDLYSFYHHVTVVTTVKDDLYDTTNYIAWGTAPSGWETNGMSCCWTFPTTNAYDMLSSSGPMYVKSFRDLNRNGRYDPESDVIMIEQILPLERTPTFFFSFGDIDGDGVSDAQEIECGTDPYNPSNLCYSLSLVEKGVYYLARNLMAEVYHGSQVLAAPTAVTGGVYRTEVSHFVVTNGGDAVAYFWDDANSNGVREVGETCVCHVIPIVGHDNFVTNTLSLGEFDADGDTMPDYWETYHATALLSPTNAATFLSPTNAADAFIDADSDGLINLHEYWAHCDPFVPDGSNTVLSIMARSVDDLLTENSSGRHTKFADHHYGSVLNTNCWCFSVDTSCASPANSWFGDFKAGTAVTPRHVVLANHYWLRPNDRISFLGTNGVSCLRTIIATNRVETSDILVCLLDDDLPNSVLPARILPRNYYSYIRTGCGLPGLMFDFSEHAIVSEFDHLPKQCGSVDGRVPVKQRRLQYFEEVESGDSGNPKFLLFEHSAILVCTLHVYGTGKSGSGPFLTSWADELQKVLNLLSDENDVPRWQLSYFDFSSYEKIDDD